MESGSTIKINYIDNQGLKQGKWIKEQIDTIVENWEAIRIGEIDTGYNKSYGVYTNIYRLIYYVGWYKDDRKENTWLIYNPEKVRIDKKTDSINIGALVYEANFRNNSLNGVLKTYYISGDIKSEIEFEDGEAHGQINCYSKNGNLKIKGQIEKDKQFFKGAEYSKYGKTRDRKFNKQIILDEYTNLEDLDNRLK